MLLRGGEKSRGFVERNQAQDLDHSLFKKEASCSRQMLSKEEDADRLEAPGGLGHWVRWGGGPGGHEEQAG